MKRCFTDDISTFETKKPQHFTSTSGTDAFRAMLVSARLVSRPALTRGPNLGTCYFCDSPSIYRNCDTCDHTICPVCTFGGSDTCLNCSVNR
ncbi:LADA_0D09032g1_1 [Lachancea dasiensis]|uniref:LADA_0D09032g1_1 n=1 Tax=Lachancea dasiensis TaxID=1072105 RepID=A0A1G4J7F1_9SACH|nr:LADA_0D09032g1_1 [Lachancea dasiensis]